jgi:TetR/AcrR family transcriptional repressor of nem operon
LAKSCEELERMARRRGFADQVAVRAACELFWEKGYEATSLAELQAVTGLSRSSMYAAYGSKRGLFERASLSYLADVIDPLLAPMEAPGAGSRDIQGFFHAMARVLRSPDTRFARRGCFVLNTVLELEHLDQPASDMVTQYRERVRAAITNALMPAEGDDARAGQAEALTAMHVGVMITARIDPVAAAIACERVAAQLSEE